ncbi:MAG TPA: permease-like cell division protein FtsX [bacterium]|nr:permease-like cell division protein FtsX [bacterium]HPN31348.1 permease-like cell division protein FtsX [bacterium]
MFFFIKEGFSNFSRNKFINIISIFVISISIFFIIFFYLLSKNIGNFIARLKSDITIIAYLNDNIESDSVESLHYFLKSNPDISEFKYLTKQQALEEFKDYSKDIPELIEGIIDNPLPAYFEIHLKKIDASIISKLLSQINNFNGIESIDSGQKKLNYLQTLNKTINYILFVIVFIMFIFSAFIAFNTIQLTFYSRAAEIEIQKLIGVTKFFIRLPFIIESAITMFISSTICISMIYIFFNHILHKLPLPILADLNFTFLNQKEIAIIYVASFLAGLIGSFAALSRFMSMSIENE